MRFDLVDLEDAANLAIANMMMMCGQREGAIPEDRDELTGLERAIFAYDDTPAGPDTVIGCAVFYQPEDVDLVWLDVLFVAEPYRRRGVGRHLLNAVCRIAARDGVLHVEFGTINDPMQALGLSCGFTPNVVWMRRPIGKAVQ